MTHERSVSFQVLLSWIAIGAGACAGPPDEPPSARPSPDEDRMHLPAGKPEPICDATERDFSVFKYHQSSSDHAGEADHAAAGAIEPCADGACAPFAYHAAGVGFGYQAWCEPRGRADDDLALDGAPPAPCRARIRIEPDEGWKRRVHVWDKRSPAHAHDGAFEAASCVVESAGDDPTARRFCKVELGAIARVVARTGRGDSFLFGFGHAAAHTDRAQDRASFALGVELDEGAPVADPLVGGAADSAHSELWVQDMECVDSGLRDREGRPIWRPAPARARDGRPMEARGGPSEGPATADPPERWPRWARALVDAQTFEGALPVRAAP